MDTKMQVQIKLEGFDLAFHQCRFYLGFWMQREFRFQLIIGRLFGLAEVKAKFSTYRGGIYLETPQNCLRYSSAFAGQAPFMIDWELKVFEVFLFFD